MSQDPSELVALTTAAHEFEGEAIAEALRAQEIPAEVFGGIAKAGLQWDIGFTDPVKVMVRRGDLGRAGAVLRAVRAESVDLDWDEVQPAGSEQAPPVPPSSHHRIATGVWTLRLLMLGWLCMLAFVAYQSRDVGYAAAGLFLLVGPAPVLLWFYKTQTRRQRPARKA